MLPNTGKNINNASRVERIRPISAVTLKRWMPFIEKLENSGEVNVRRTLVSLATSFKEESNINIGEVVMIVVNKQHSGIGFQALFMVSMLVLASIGLLTSPMDASSWLTYLVTISCLIKDHLTCYNKLAIDLFYLGFCGDIETLPNTGKNINNASRVERIRPISAVTLKRWMPFIEKLENSGEVNVRRTQTFSLYG